MERNPQQAVGQPVMNNILVKNQHYIPEGFLKGFTDSDGKLVEVLLRNKKIYRTSPSNSMSEKFVYEHDNLRRNTLEKYFAKLDSNIVPRIKLINKEIERLKNNDSSIEQIKAMIEELLPIFVIFYYRSGALLTESSFFDARMKIPLLTEKILNHQYIKALSQTIILGYNFALIESNNDFLLSDQFMSTAALDIKGQIANISNRHIGFIETLILIPISSIYYIVYWNSQRKFVLENNTFKLLDNNQVIQFNSIIINNSYIKCVGAEEERIKEVTHAFHEEYPSQIFIGGGKSGRTFGATRKKEVFFYDIDKKAFELFDPGYYSMFKKLKRNDPCACPSGKKYKKCHMDAFVKFESLINNKIATGNYVKDIRIKGTIACELPIDSWGSQ
ncbi:MAG: DUF4238 domain-containing protein [candidate division Zixibacteria bacterium]